VAPGWDVSPVKKNLMKGLRRPFFFPQLPRKSTSFHVAPTPIPPSFSSAPPLSPQESFPPPNPFPLEPRLGPFTLYPFLVFSFLSWLVRPFPGRIFFLSAPTRGSFSPSPGQRPTCYPCFLVLPQYFLSHDRGVFGFLPIPPPPGIIDQLSFLPALGVSRFVHFLRKALSPVLYRILLRQAPPPGCFVERSLSQGSRPPLICPCLRHFFFSAPFVVFSRVIVFQALDSNFPFLVVVSSRPA